MTAADKYKNTFTKMSGNGTELSAIHQEIDPSSVKP